MTPLTINRLAERDVGAMIDRVIGNQLLPANIGRTSLSEPMAFPYCQEMTRAVLEAKDEGAAERTIAAVPSPSIAVPPSLHASLMARLDRLGAAKEVAQIGAAIGREFTLALLAAVVRKPEPELGRLWICRKLANSTMQSVIEEAIAQIKTSKERWWEAEVNRIAGEIALLSPEADAAKAEMFFERALAVARQQRARSWELRASMNLGSASAKTRAKEPAKRADYWPRFTGGLRRV